MPTLPSRSETNPLIPQKKNPLSGMPSIPKIETKPVQKKGPIAISNPTTAKQTKPDLPKPSTVAKKKGGLFDDDEEAVVIEAKKKPELKKTKGLFDDDEDEQPFGKTKKTTLPPTTGTSKPVKKGLFDDEVEEEFPKKK